MRALGVATPRVKRVRRIVVSSVGAGRSAVGDESREENVLLEIWLKGF